MELDSVHLLHGQPLGPSGLTHTVLLLLTHPGSLSPLVYSVACFLLGVSMAGTPVVLLTP